MDLLGKFEILMEELAELKNSINAIKAPVHNQLLTPEDAAAFLGVSKKSVYNYRKSGKLNYLEFAGSIRFTIEDLMAFASSKK